jgi:hypothetical protein
MLTFSEILVYFEFYRIDPSRFKCWLGFDSDGGEVLFHAAVTPKSDIISGGVDDLNPIELSQNGPTTTTGVTSSDVSKNPNIPSLPLPPHIEDLDREAILTEGLFDLICIWLSLQKAVLCSPLKLVLHPPPLSIFALLYCTVGFTDLDQKSEIISKISLPKSMKHTLLCIQGLKCLFF